jgi:hypothetical protein
LGKTLCSVLQYNFVELSILKLNIEIVTNEDRLIFGDFAIIPNNLNDFDINGIYPAFVQTSNEWVTVSVEDGKISFVNNRKILNGSTILIRETWIKQNTIDKHS